MSDRLGELKSGRGSEDLFIPASGAKPKRAARESSKADALPAREASTLPVMPVSDLGREYHTYALTKGQRALIEAHARHRYEIGYINRLDYSQPLRDMLEYFQAHEEEGNAWIANKYKNHGNRR